MINTPSTSSDSEQLAHPWPPQAPWCLFLDIDGTLLDIAPTPDAVNVDAALLDLLRRLERACDGAIALVTGRPIAAVDSLFAPLQLPVAGVHGFERRNAQGHYFRPGFVGAGLSYLRSEVTALAQSLHGVLLKTRVVRSRCTIVKRRISRRPFVCVSRAWCPLRCRLSSCSMGIMSLR